MKQLIPLLALPFFFLGYVHAQEKDSLITTDLEVNVSRLCSISQELSSTSPWDISVRATSGDILFRLLLSVNHTFRKPKTDLFDGSYSFGCKKKDFPFHFGDIRIFPQASCDTLQFYFKGRGQDTVIVFESIAMAEKTCLLHIDNPSAPSTNIPDEEFRVHGDMVIPVEPDPKMIETPLGTEIVNEFLQGKSVWVVLLFGTLGLLTAIITPLLIYLFREELKEKISAIRFQKTENLLQRKFLHHMKNNWWLNEIDSYVEHDSKLDGRFFKRMNIEDILKGHLANNGVVLITGKTGMGKTTLLKYLALLFAKEQGEGEALGIHRKLLPIFIDLHEYPFSEDQDPYNWVKYAAEQRRFPIPGYSSENVTYFLEKRLGQGNCIILIDGFSDALKRAQKTYMKPFVESLNTFFNQYIEENKRNIFILSHSDFSSLPRSLAHRFRYGEQGRLQYSTVELQPLTFEEQKDFVLHLLQVVPLADRNAKQIQLTELIKEHSLSKISENPFFLNLICVLHIRNQLGLGPNSLSSIFELFEQILNRKMEERSQDKKEQLSKQELEIALMKFAYFTKTSQQSYSSEIADFDDHCRELTGILTVFDKWNIEFTHRYYQAYFIAKYLDKEELNIELILAKLDEGTWSGWNEVLLFYAGLVDGATDLIRELTLLPIDANQQDQLIHNRYLLAAYCIRHAKQCEETLVRKVDLEIKKVLHRIENDNEREEEWISAAAALLPSSRQEANGSTTKGTIMDEYFSKALT